MPLKTYSEIAQEVETALMAIISGKLNNYNIGGQSYGLLDVDKLEKIYRYYRGKALEDEGGYITLAGVDNQ